MSTLRATNLKGGSAGSAPNLPDGAVVTGVITATSFSGSGANLTGIDATSIKHTDGNVRIQATATGAVVTGVLTAPTVSGTTGSFTGNVSVGGTLTYEDVTNVDSVGMVTARTGIKVLAGGINAVGVVTATSFAGSGANLTGIDAAPTVAATAKGAIAANKAVILKADGRVEQAQNFVPTDTGKFDETVVNYMPGFDSTTSTDHPDLFPGGEFMADWDPINQKIVAIRHDTSTYAPTLYVGTPSGDGDSATVTWDSGTAISGTFTSGDYGAVIRYNPHYQKFLVMWSKNDGVAGTNLCHVSLSGGNLTIGTVTKQDLWTGTGNGGRKYYNMMLTMTYESVMHSIVITARVAMDEGSGRRQHITKAINMSGTNPDLSSATNTNYFGLIDHSGQGGVFTQPIYINQDAALDLVSKRVCYFTSFTMRNSSNNFAHYLAAVSITVNADYDIVRGTVNTYEDHWNYPSNYSGRTFSARLAYHKDKGCCTSFWIKGDYNNDGQNMTSYAAAITYPAGGGSPSRGTILSFNHDEADGSHTLWGGDQCSMIGRDDGTSYWMARRSEYVTNNPNIWPRIGIKFTMSGSTGSETIAVQFITNAWKSGGATALGTNGFSWWQSQGGGSYSNGEQCVGVDIGNWIWWIGASRGSVTSSDAAYFKRVIAHGGYFVGGGNLTTSNYLGFSDAAYTDGQTVKVKVIGNTTTQSGLTTNTNYYVNNVGDITTSSTDTALIGRAINTTQILIKN
tara:strand:+ start:28 stop:2238 length:2211 start_codon:yes stop_codon:yes gene_type:complete